jgi:TQXA domain-containing protein/LPXTG-motif cell wall-anchored protein
VLRRRTLLTDKPSRGARFARGTVAVVVGGLLAIGGGTAASAEEPVQGKPGSWDTDATALNLIDGLGRDTQRRVPRLYLEIDGKKVVAYCIDIKTELTHGLTYAERPWSARNVDSDLEKIQWVLTHGWPTVSAEGLLKSAKVEKPANTSDELLEKMVYGATQAAVWRYSDGVFFRLRESSAGFNIGISAEQYDAVYKMYKYLIENATNQPEPAPKLEIDPITKSGEAGKKIGPFTIKSGGGTAELTTTGGTIVDADGKPVTKLSNGGQFFVQSDTAGTVTGTAKGSGQVPIGRVFTYTKQAENKKQKMILAGVAGKPLETTATVTVTPPVPTLPVTGFQVTTAALAGLVLVGGGTLLVFGVRRRRVRFTA